VRITKTMTLISIVRNLVVFCLISSCLTATGTTLTDRCALRLPRPGLLESRFNGISAGYTKRWFSNIRNPSCCDMILCHGSCAQPSRSSYDRWLNNSPVISSTTTTTHCESESTPCCLRTFHNLLRLRSPDCCENNTR